MKITYNSPLILSYALISCLVLILSQTIFPNFVLNYFCLPGNHTVGSGYFRLVSYIAGHADWSHLVGNFSIILLIGPLLEEKLGSGRLLIYILLTAIISGILNTLLFNEGLLGASGIAFMIIILASMTDIKKGQLPLTFLLVCALYLGMEIYNGLAVKDNISQFGHILGGGCGIIFGLLGKK